jgi:hypothetical protein
MGGATYSQSRFTHTWPLFRPLLMAYHIHHSVNRFLSLTHKHEKLDNYKVREAMVDVLSSQSCNKALWRPQYHVENV